MAKRFIDSGLFDDQWFSDLSQDGKIFWVYFITKCDHAGLLRVNRKLIQFQTGIKSLETVIKELGNSLVTVKEELLFCPKYLKFQYPDFPKSNVMQQFGAINLLKSVGLWDEQSNSYLTVPKQLPNSLQTLSKELPNSYGNGNDIVNGNSINSIKINSISINTAENFELFWKAYPKKKSKGDAEKAWKKIKPDTELTDKMIKKIELLKYSIEWMKQEGQFIPYPASWLNSKGWEDETNVETKSIENGQYKTDPSNKW